MGDFADLTDAAVAGTPPASAPLAVRLAAPANPDQAAEANALARRYGIPSALAEQFAEDYRARALTEDARDTFQKSPRLGSWIAEQPERAKVAKDDFETLSGIDAAIRTLKNVPSAIASAFPRAGSGLYGAAAAPFEVAGQGFRAAEDAIASMFGAPAGMGTNAGEAVGGFLRNEQQAAKAVSEGIYSAPKDAGIIERGVGSGLQSAAQTVLTLPIALRQGGENAALGVLGLVTGGEAYGKARDKGLAPAQAAVYGTEDAVAEVVTERLPFAKLLGDIKAGTGGAKMLVNNLVREVPGELAATLWQNFNEWANLNPEKSVAQWLGEQPEALAETIVATLVGGGAQVGAIKTVQAGMDRLGGKAQRAEQDAAQMEALAKLAEASKLRGRDAVTFREYVQQVAEENDDAPTEFYIDGQVLANTLNQSGMTMQELEAIAPVVAAQIEAAATGGDVRIPVSEFMTAGEAITAPLIDHLRTAPDAMSRAEAQEYIRTEGDRLGQEVERAMQDSVGRDEFRQGVEAVRTEFQTELDATKRFTSDVNRAYADLLANFYGATAVRLGVKPQELLQKYRLRVQAKVEGGQRVMEQGGEALAAIADNLARFPRQDPKGMPLSEFASWVKGRTKARTELAAQLAPQAEGLLVPVRGGGFFGVSVDTRPDGKGWRITRFDSAMEPMGHDVYATADEAVAVAIDAADDVRILNQSVAEYQGSHKPPGPDSASLADLTANGVYPDDVYGPNGARFYGDGSARDSVAFSMVQRLKGRPNATVTIYRAVPYEKTNAEKLADIEKQLGKYMARRLLPAGVDMADEVQWYEASIAERDRLRSEPEPAQKEAIKINAGDWVTITRNYATEHGQGALGGNYKIISKTVKAGELFTNGDSIQEWGYWPANTYNQDERPAAEKGAMPRAQISLPQSFEAGPAVISLLAGADLSSFLHESGHLFLEVQTDLAIKIQQQIDSGASVSDGERAIVADMNRLLEWFGVKGVEQASGATGGALDQPAYHGTPHAVDRFSLHKIGSGEGAQAYGWGLYFAGKREVAEHYRKTLSDGTGTVGSVIVNGQKTDTFSPEGHAARLLYYNDQREMRQLAKQMLKEALAGEPYTIETAEKQGLTAADYYGRLNAFISTHTRRDVKVIKGNLYEVELPDDDRLLDYDKSLSAQPQYVKDRLKASGILADWKESRSDYSLPQDVRPNRGGALYALLSHKFGGDQAASQWLHGIGVVGMRYKAGQIAGVKGGGYNYVIWDEGAIGQPRSLYQGGPEIGPAEPSPQGRTPLETWAMMSLDEKRASHEQFARGFEAFAFEGKAPSIELQGVFQRFRSWLMQVYKTLRNLNVTLTDDVRAVMGRMIATDYAIEEAEAQRAMGPLFKDAEKAGMTLEEFNKYQALASGATEAAVDQLQTRSLADMKWLGRARDKALKARQQEVDELRRDVRQEVRSEVLSEPVYRAWQFLTAKGDEGDTARGEKPAKSKGVDRDRDNLFTAIAKLGGLRRDELASQWGVDPADMKAMQSGVFGAPVARKEGGLSIDAMMEALVEDGYILPDEYGKADVADFEVKFDAQRRGEDQYSVWRDMGGPTAQALGEDKIAGKLNTSALREQYGTGEQAVWRKLSARRMTSDSGIDPDVVAETFGFDSGDALVKALADAVPPSEVIEARTDQRMLEMFGDITSPQALERAADEAVHNEARARFIAAELKALQAANEVRADTGKRTKQGRKLTTDVLAAAAKDYAAQIVGRSRVRDLRPAQYAAAEVRSAKLAEKAFAAGKLEEAAMHKRNQLVNHYAAKAAYEAQAEVKKHSDYFRKFEKRPASVDPGYLDQIDGMLERFDFKPVSLREVDRRKSLMAWYDEQVAMGVVPAIPDELLDDANRKSYKDMTIEELRGLRDAVRNIEHLGRLKNKLMLARDQRTFDAIADEMAQTIRDNGGEPREVKLEGEKGVKPWFDGLAAMHRKLSSYFRQMDGGRDDGPLYQYIGRAMNERGAWEDTQIEQATVKLQALYKPLTKMRGGITGARSKLFIPAINASLTRGGRLAVALNWGNSDNRQRIMDGDKWSEAQVRAILSTLTAEELAFVNGVWEFIDSYWPEVAAKEKRITGVEPEKVKAEPFTVKSADGVEVSMRGGYYPLKYDTDRSDRADTQEAAQVAKEMMRGAMTRATTRRGHTKERQQEVKRAVRKDLNVITQHVTQVVHDLAWHEWLIDTNRLLRDDRVVDAIREHYGPKVLKTMRDDIAGIATADVVPQSDLDKALLLLRSNVSRATMGASLTTAFLQPFGLTQSMARIGAKHVLRGGARWAGEAARMENTLAWIQDKSEFMRLRAKSFNRELREISGTVAGKSAAMRAVDGGLFWLMQKMQLVADIPTWIGQYEKSIAEGLDEASAVAQADRAVIEAQGSGQTKDLAEVQRKHPMLTQFYSYFSVTLNLVAEKTATTDFKNPRAVAGWLGDMALLMVIPAIMPALLLDLARGGGEDDEEGDLAKKIAKWQIGYLMGTVVGLREGSGMLEGFDYSGPPVGRIVTDIGKAGKQTAQGELDEPAVLAYARLMGTAFGIPVVQAIRSYKGWKAWDEGQAGPQAMLIGPPPKQ